MGILVSNNRFEGNIPGNVFSEMSSSLTELNLLSNLFAGPWPEEFRDLTMIETINISYNSVSYSTPLGLGHCVNLISLDVSLNNLTGEILGDLGSLTHQTFFNASFNNFTGPLPGSGIFNSK
jgi:hypothetical protein